VANVAFEISRPGSLDHGCPAARTDFFARGGNQTKGIFDKLRTGARKVGLPAYEIRSARQIVQRTMTWISAAFYNFLSRFLELQLAKAEQAHRVVPRPADRASAKLLFTPIEPEADVKRDLRLDFFRGLALLFIFFDHIPDNLLSKITLHSIAFSDAAEVFVFVSGYAAALAYGSILTRKGFVEATLRIYRRVWQLYIAHIFIFIVLVAVISHVSMVHWQINAGEFGLTEFLKEPQVAVVKAILLQFQPQFLDILPLYIVLLVVFPAVLFLIARHPLLALLPSASIYLLTQLLGWQVHGYPGSHVWFFNPLAWQFLFVVGAVLAYPHGAGINWIPKGQLLTTSATAVTALAAVTNVSWLVHFNYSEVPGILLNLLGPYAGDKTNLGPLRLLSFLALALTTVRFMRPTSGLLRGRASAWLIACGQNSLHVFCLGILLSVIAHFVLVIFDGGVPFQLAVDLAGCALMIGLAQLLSWCKAESRCS
jgi:hypothetical protein